MITGNDVIEIGIKEGPAVGLALEVAKSCVDEIGARRLLEGIVEMGPEEYLQKEGLSDPPKPLDDAIEALCNHLYQKKIDEQLREAAAPRDEPLAHTTFGADLIDEETHLQMHDSMRLPISVAGALMPDAHVAYGLPVGGVLATEEAVIPYAVGVDIACRMMISLYPVPPAYITDRRDQIVRAIERETAFGAGKGFKKKRDHAIMDDERWDALPLFKKLKNKAHYQLGSSGGGNHFLSLGVVEVSEPIGSPYGFVPPATYVAIMTHSGSRAFGFAIAKYYTQIAKDTCYGLPKELERLAWLEMGTSAAEEYWLAMNFAGDYASACHHLIHEHVGRAAGLRSILSIENHHNFAWKERHMIGGEEKEVFVHRKGATPASDGELGIIPGTMADVSYIVRGLGNEASLRSASHGAGRQMSRSQAKREISPEKARAYVDAAGVTLLGGGLDEAPFAYKKIDDVIEAQRDLVEPVGCFTPKIVMMASDSSPI